VVPAEVDLAAVVRDELEQLRGAHPGRTLEFDCGCDARGRCDGARLQQLVRNLVQNALRYGAPDSPVRVARRDAAPDIMIDVINHGPPIDPAALREIFDPLKRAAAPGIPRAHPGGLGLGLYIVREIARAHGGDAQVRSSAGETTFTVRLPRAGAVR
jgi:signal transduction histidine kinase